MTTEQTTDPITIRGHVDRAAESIGRVWPLYADVAANPLSGFEDRPFPEAVAEAEDLFGGRGYPRPEQFREAFEDGRIDPEIVRQRLRDHGIDLDPEEVLQQMEARAAGPEPTDEDPPENEALLDRLLCKWLAAFLEQGQAAWPMPDREAGFYGAWRELAPYDTRIPERQLLGDVPESPTDAISATISQFSEERWEDVFEHHLAALPGWTGYIKQREAADDDWQEKYPVTLVDYLAVRLVLASHLGVDLAPDVDADDDSDDDHEVPLAEIWLTAWEETYREGVVEDVTRELEERDDETDEESERPDAQLVFCIDTRSEIVRRHVEATGDYETHGYAGFFGIPMEYEDYESGLRTTSCPVILDPSYRIGDRPRDEHRERASIHDRWTNAKKAGTKLMKSLKNDLVSAFGFVEVAGGLFAPPMALRTLVPSSVHRTGEYVSSVVGRPAEFAQPDLDADPEDVPGDDIPEGMTLEQKVICAEAAFDLMGWEEFAPVVVFAGHASQTVNNPYESSIDCGACSGSSGVPNARVLAAICNDDAVRAELRERGIEIPEDTVFVPGEHNTTTDEITLFPSEEAERRHEHVLRRLRHDVETAQENATAERMETLGVEPSDTVAETERRASDWAEPRPEIGLSGNASFVIGPREMTADVDLDGRAFLHTYDASTDPEGEALENIMTGPLVVTKMINAQYYFSAVDESVYGSGSKATHNPVGKIGVYQGNGGDLMVGLPIQSLQSDDGQMYHSPLRQSVVIHAPVEQVTEIIERHDELATLFDNGWMHLTVIDPEQDDTVFRYVGDLSWDPPRRRVPIEA